MVVSSKLCPARNCVVPMPLFRFGLLFLIRLPKWGVASAFEMGGNAMTTGSDSKIPGGLDVLDQ
jgi:hypothetical protein